MAQLVSLQKNAHQYLKVDTALAEAQGGLLNMIPVMLSEFLKLAVQFPIALTKDSNTGKFVCVALFGFQPGENLFFQQGQWNSLYIPLQIARQPFFLGEDTVNAAGDKQFVICIDIDHHSVQQQQGELLFDANGNESPYLNKIKYLLAELLNGEEKMEHFIEKLLSLQLLQPMQLEITFESGELIRIDGMYTINEDRLQSLASADVIELHNLGYLSYIHTMRVSTGHIYSLVDKKNKLSQQSNRIN